MVTINYDLAWAPYFKTHVLSITCFIKHMLRIFHCLFIVFENPTVLHAIQSWFSDPNVPLSFHCQLKIHCSPFWHKFDTWYYREWLFPYLKISIPASQVICRHFVIWRIFVEIWCICAWFHLKNAESELGVKWSLSISNKKLIPQYPDQEGIEPKHLPTKLLECSAKTLSFQLHQLQLAMHTITSAML